MSGDFARWLANETAAAARHPVDWHAVGMALTEAEWDSLDSTDYHDGHERGEEDARTDCTLSPEMRGAMSRPWLEGYEDGLTTAAERTGGAFTDVEYSTEREGAADA